VPGADGSGFPAEHLPYGVFTDLGSTGAGATAAGSTAIGPGTAGGTAAGPATAGGTGAGGAARCGARIGDSVLDLARLAADGLVDGPFDHPSLDAFMAAGPEAWRAVRRRLTELVCDERWRRQVEPALVPVRQVVLSLPFTVADYVDFYSSIEHATNLGRLFRPDAEPLLPNWRHLPVAYHGRAGTVVVSGTPIVRPQGQRRTPDGEVVFGPSQRLDIELEVGFVIGAGSPPGRPVPIGEAPDHVFGVVLVNDWSARDIQAWEYQPLGPFLGKSFATSIGGWITPLDALAGCRVEGPPQEPPPLDYLALSEPWGLDLHLTVELAPAAPADEATTGPAVISRTGFGGLYWRFPQQIAHMTVNGAHLRPGDLIASGTVSGPTRGSEGSLIELTRNGAEPLDIGGVPRSFLEDGDEIVLTGRADVGDGVTLALGEVRGRILPPW
jgi:fumarylacetoacetase